MALVALMVVAAPAEAQRQQGGGRQGGGRQQGMRQQAAQQQTSTPNNDFWSKTSVGIEYQIDPQWSFHFDSELLLDRNASRLHAFHVRPGFEYAFSPKWAAAAGYVQYQRYPTGTRTQRGPFQDILHRTKLGGVFLNGRLRAEELFFENTALLGRTRGLVGVRIPIADSPWEFAASTEFFLNLKVDGTGYQSGIHQNRTYAGFGRSISPSIKLSAGYELDTFERNGTLRNIHLLRVGFAFKLN
jgi:hypothetical protein